jgi:hypothetical protein
MRVITLRTKVTLSRPEVCSPHIQTHLHYITSIGLSSTVPARSFPSTGATDLEV